MTTFIPVIFKVSHQQWEVLLACSRLHFWCARLGWNMSFLCYIYMCAGRNKCELGLSYYRISITPTTIIMTIIIYYYHQGMMKGKHTYNPPLFSWIIHFALQRKSSFQLRINSEKAPIRIHSWNIQKAKSWRKNDKFWLVPLVSLSFDFWSAIIRVSLHSPSILCFIFDKNGSN